MCVYQMKPKHVNFIPLYILNILNRALDLLVKWPIITLFAQCQNIIRFCCLDTTLDDLDSCISRCMFAKPRKAGRLWFGLLENESTIFVDRQSS